MPESRSTATVVYRAILLAAGLIVLGLLFQQLVTLLLAVLVTVIIAIPLSAAASKLESRGLPRALGALLALLGGVAVIAGVLALVIPPFVDQVQEFVDDVPEIATSLEERVDDLTGAEPGEVGDNIRDFLQGYVDEPERLVGGIFSIGLGVAGALGAIILILITAYYMALRPQPLVDGMLSVVPPDSRERALTVMRRLRLSWIGWMQGVAVDMVLTGGLVYVGLRIVDLEFASLFAIFSALLCLVPYFGAIVGGIPPVLFALTDSPGKALVVLGIYLVVQQLESNVTIPIVMSRTVKLHPAVIAVGVVLVGQVFGFLGLFVAVPILSAVVILVDELWVKPSEAAHARRTREALDLPPAAERSLD